MKTIGITAGAFDLLHAGHCLMLKEAKSLCDYLIVGLHTDPSLERKEKNKPIQTVKERRIQLEACRYVDMIFEYIYEHELEEIVKKLKPDIRIKGSDHINDKSDDSIKIHYHNRNHNWSSSELRKRLR